MRHDGRGRRRADLRGRALEARAVTGREAHPRRRRLALRPEPDRLRTHRDVPGGGSDDRHGSSARDGVPPARVDPARLGRRPDGRQARPALGAGLGSRLAGRPDGVRRDPRVVRSPGAEMGRSGAGRDRDRARLGTPRLRDDGDGPVSRGHPAAGVPDHPPVGDAGRVVHRIRQPPLARLSGRGARMVRGRCVVGSRRAGRDGPPGSRVGPAAVRGPVRVVRARLPRVSPRRMARGAPRPGAVRRLAGRADPSRHAHPA